MATIRPVRPLVVAAAVLASLALTSCSTDSGASSPTSPTTTVAASAPTDAWAGTPEPVSMDEDRSAAAVCGQISALSTVALNAYDGLQRGALSQEQYEALTAAQRFGYEHLSSTDAQLDDAIDYAHEYLDAHPAPASGAAIEDGPEWDLVGRTLNAACRAAGSNIVVAAQYGG